MFTRCKRRSATATAFNADSARRGSLMTAYAYLQEDHEFSEAEIREELAGNLCRCTGYQSIVAGVQLAAVRLGKREESAVRFVGESIPGRRPSHPERAGQIRRRSRPAEHAACVVRAQPVRARPHHGIDTQRGRRPVSWRCSPATTCASCATRLDIARRSGVKFPEFYPLVDRQGALRRRRGRHGRRRVALPEAEDGCDLVEVDYNALPAVADYDDAIDPTKPALFDELGDNVVTTNPPVDVGRCRCGLRGSRPRHHGHVAPAPRCPRPDGDTWRRRGLRPFVGRADVPRVDAEPARATPAAGHHARSSDGTLPRARQRCGWRLRLEGQHVYARTSASPPPAKRSAGR